MQRWVSGWPVLTELHQSRSWYEGSHLHKHKCKWSIHAWFTLMQLFKSRVVIIHHEVQTPHCSGCSLLDWDLRLYNWREHDWILLTMFHLILKENAVFRSDSCRWLTWVLTGPDEVSLWGVFWGLECLWSPSQEPWECNQRLVQKQSLQTIYSMLLLYYVINNTYMQLLFTCNGKMLI